MAKAGPLGFSTGVLNPEVADAASVILVREKPKLPWEIFLLKRHGGQKFMGGAYVFPGGRLDLRDMDPAFEKIIFCGPLTDGELLGEVGLAADRARGLFVAAIRETFEEAGVLLACGPKGETTTIFGDGHSHRKDQWRKKILTGEVDFLTFALEENIYLDFRLLGPYAHWLTPEIERRRFDTRFFAARLPDNQEARHDGGESSGSGWFTPTEALLAHDRGTIDLMPPTLKLLEELSGFPQPSDLFAPRGPRNIPLILPEVIVRDGATGVIFPHDLDYQNLGFRRPGRPGETSRVMLKDGRWQRESFISP